MKYRRYHHKSKKVDIFDILADSIIAASILLGRLIYVIFRFLYRRIKVKRDYQIISTPPAMSYDRGDSYGHSNIVGQSDTISEESRYTLKNSLLTEAEQEFLSVLKQVVGSRYLIESQVPLSGIVKPIDSSEHWTNYHDFNLISRKSIDFVLYDEEFKPHVAIELDDRSHLRWDRIKRDQQINEIMKNVGLKMIRISVSYKYEAEALKEKIFGLNK
jgi:Protein of unknown function (DUF2726)